MLAWAKRSISISGVSGEGPKGACNKANGERDRGLRWEEMQGLLATG